MTARLLNEYKELIKNTATDLEELLHGIDDKMKERPSKVAGDAADDGDFEEEEHSIKEERASVQQCLMICEGVAAHIEEVQAKDLADMPTPSSARHASIKLIGTIPARLTTSNTLENCKQGLGVASSQLKMQLDDLNKRMGKLSQHDGITDEQSPDIQSMKEELESIRQCLAISKAAEQSAQERRFVFEDIGTTDDAHQVIVATLGDLISARRVTAGARSTQWLGQMSDESLRSLSKDLTKNGVGNRPDTVGNRPDTVGNRPDAEGNRPDTKPGTHFEGRHGTGRKLK